MQKRKFRLSIPAKFRFIRIVLIFIVVSFFINMYISIKMLSLGGVVAGEDMVYFSSQLNFEAILLIFLVTIIFILHRGFGAFSRIENTLDQILKGNYSLRVNLREGDVLAPLFNKVNEIIDLLEKKSKQNNK